MLAAAYLDLARETSDIGDTLRAERAARASIALRRERNESAFHVLAVSLMIQHRFREALETIDQGERSGATAFFAGAGQMLIVKADVFTEIGDLLSARRALSANPRVSAGSSGKAAHARLVFLFGNSGRALLEMRSATAEVDRNPDLRRAQVAWFHVRTGNILALMGRFSESAAEYRTALDLFPRDVLALTGLAKIAYLQRDWKAATGWAGKASAIVPTPELAALMGDAKMKIGDAAGAKVEYALVDSIATLARAQGVVYDRQRSLYCIDHNVHLGEGLSLARKELQQRKDIYAYDTLAWALAKTGNVAAAQKMIAAAMANGTPDPVILYHAAQIAKLAHHDAAVGALEARAHAIWPDMASEVHFYF